MQAKSKFNGLLTFDAAGRNLDYYPNDFLERAIKVCVTNSLLHLKLMTMKGRARIEMAHKLHPICPTLDAVPIAP